MVKTIHSHSQNAQLVLSQGRKLFDIFVVYEEA